MRRFLPQALKYARAREFETLKQTEGMTVMEYHLMFTRLSYYAPRLVAIEEMRAKCLVNGLPDYLFRSVVRTRYDSNDEVLESTLLSEERSREIAPMGQQMNSHQNGGYNRPSFSSIPSNRNSQSNPKQYSQGSEKSVRTSSPCSTCGRIHVGSCYGTGIDSFTITRNPNINTT
ncbi:DNA/RNA polymerases superfamily protein [Senna tora]|uniref:DNA/RNA polymerases superfamily protein n=1 Tax=Senna tora TaxID=362788 RepID=A0A834WV86_9FABA|nr:DNA/RNA polymerases superfamily protein [Senna tora]